MCCVPLQLARAHVMSSERTRTYQRLFRLLLLQPEGIPAGAEQHEVNQKRCQGHRNDINAQRGFEFDKLWLFHGINSQTLCIKQLRLIGCKSLPFCGPRIVHECNEISIVGLSFADEVGPVTV